MGDVYCPHQSVTFDFVSWVGGEIDTALKDSEKSVVQPHQKLEDICLPLKKQKKSPETVKTSKIHRGPKTLHFKRHPGQVSLHRPSELVLGTAEIRSVFPDLQLLRGRMVGTVVSGQVGSWGLLGEGGEELLVDKDPHVLIGILWNLGSPVVT